MSNMKRIIFTAVCFLPVLCLATQESKKFDLSYSLEHRSGLKLRVNSLHDMDNWGDPLRYSLRADYGISLGESKFQIFAEQNTDERAWNRRQNIGLNWSAGGPNTKFNFTFINQYQLNHQSQLHDSGMRLKLDISSKF
jgi:hypothetical protein